MGHYNKKFPEKSGPPFLCPAKKRHFELYNRSLATALLAPKPTATQIPGAQTGTRIWTRLFSENDERNNQKSTKIPSAQILC